MNRLLTFVLVFLCVLPAAAHIGTQNVFYEGAAGPYQVRVFLEPPPVVPGRAQVHVRVHNQPNTVTRVNVLPVRWDAGRKGAPPPDRASPVQGEAGLFSTELWVMDFGAYSVFVDVEGQLGKGTAIVPFNSVSSRRLAMPTWLTALFLLGGLALVSFLVFIIGAALRESVLAPGTTPDLLRRRRGRLGMAVAIILLTAVLAKGRAWWNAVDRHFQQARLYKMLEVPVRLETNAPPRLEITVAPDPENWRDHTPLVADHGKLMHLFLIADDRMNAFAHLHPQRVNETAFQVNVPPLPAGSYSVYADVNHESGLTQTLVGKVSIPAPLNSPASDPDDSFWASDLRADQGQLPLGGTIKPLSPLTFRAGEEALLRFEALAPDGRPLPLEPYLGMWSHAVIRAEDATVFSHLHPSGTISMTSQELFARRERGEDLRKPIEVICGRIERELTFPFSFPKPGRYRIWVQVRSSSQVQTASFDLTVT